MDALKYITPKFFTTIKDYSKGQFVKDLIAGVIVAIIALPLSIALAIASGVNPEQGLYTAVVAGFFISFLGGSLSSDWWTYRSLRCHHLWHHRPVWHGGSDCCHAHGWDSCLLSWAPAFWRPD